MPLLEIVMEPDMRSAEEAAAFMEGIRHLVRWLGISDGNMEEGSLRCDVNVSVRKQGDPVLGTRCEIKNINSMRFARRAIEFETARQIEILENGGSIQQETRGFDVAGGKLKLEVTLEFYPSKTDTSRFTLPSQINWSEGLHRCFRNIRVSSGRLLRVDSTQLWVITRSREPVQLNYEIIQNFSGEQVTVETSCSPIILRDYFHIPGECLFLIPRHYQLYEVTVRWSGLPKKWVLQNSFNTGQMEQKFQATNTDWRHTNWVAGDFRILKGEALGFLTDALPVKFHQGKELANGSVVLYAFQGSELYLIKISADGTIYPHSLSGQIVRDSTFNCIPDSFDSPLKDWVVQVLGIGLTQYTKSGIDGQYNIFDLENGDYEIVLVPPSYLWEPCLDSVQLTFNSSTPVEDTLDFPVQSLYDCPLLELDSASIPYTQNGNLLTFELGNVPAGECGSFHIYTTTSCDAENGQTLCVEAHIYPDTLCAMNIPNWSGAQIEVSTECSGDSVLFKIQNTGSANMLQTLDFIIVDDHVITRQGMFNLPAGGMHEESVPADGSTWRLIAEQEPGFPFGPQSPSVGMEACQTNPQGGFTTGMMNMFPNYTGNPFHDTDCRTVIGSWDPNDKQALPIGVDAPHFIDQNQPIEYLIRFQNTGTDTAFTVVIRDTLSSGLNPASIRIGAASHPYSWELCGLGILKVTFANILLPDSNVNEAASHGFIQFKINQQRDNPLGMILENQAAIYFDFNEPVLTNTVFHTVGKNYLPTATTEPKTSVQQLRLYPNPATQRSFVQLDALNQPGRRLVLRDITGRIVQEWPVRYLRQEIGRSGQPAGLYWLELLEGAQLVAVGKLVWTD